MKNIKKTAIISLISILILGAIGPFSLAYGRRTFQIEVTANLAYGTILYNGGHLIDEVPFNVGVFPNKDVTFTITPNFGYHIEQINVNGDEVSGSNYGETTYTFTKVKENYFFEVVFSENAAVSVPGATINVLNDAPQLLPGFNLIPGIEGTVAPFFEIEVDYSLQGDIYVTLTYDDTGLTEDQEKALRLYIGNAVDFDGDGTVNGNDIALIQAAQKSENPEDMFDVNGDSVVDIVDENIVKEYANSGLVVSPGNYEGAGQFRVPWIDITYGEVDFVANKIMGLTWHLSIFGCR